MSGEKDAGPSQSRSVVSITRSISAPPLDVPPVPERRESLAASAASAAGVQRPRSLVGSFQPARPTTTITAQCQAAAFRPKGRTARVRTSKVMQTVEASSDVSDTSHEFEAESLHKESFKVLYDFFLNDILCDVEIVVGSRRINCHRVVLACVSQYFKTMFTSEMAESRRQSVNIKDIDETALEILIKFAYTSKILLNVENVQSLLYASSILQIELVADACCSFMMEHLHPSNCIGVRTFAEQHGRAELINKADQYIRDNFLQVVEDEEFVSINASVVEMMIDSSDLNIVDEKQAFEAVMKWVKHDVINRKCYLSGLLKKVKLALLPPAYLVKEVGPDPLIKGDLQCRDIVDDAKVYHMSHSLPGMEAAVTTVLPRKGTAGVVFCVGGRGSSGDPFKSIECYDLRLNRWFHVTEMSTRRRHVGVVSVNGKLYAVGGHDGSEHLNSGEKFDPAENKWTSIASMSTLRRGLAVACLGGPLYAIGGLDDNTCYNTVERYDPDNDAWSCVQSMNTPRGGVAVATLKNFIYAVGGNDGAASLETCEKYDPHLNKWSLCAAMNTRRAGAGVAELNGNLFVVGGFDDNSPLNSVERYDPEANLWSTMTAMSCPRGGVGVAPLAGKIYAVGGHDGTNYLSSVEAYNPQQNSWEMVSSIATCRAGAGIATVDCHVTDLADMKATPTLAAAAGRL